MFNRLLTLFLIFLIALPAQARFLTQDQWEGDINNPPSLHKYTYVYQNPTKYTDPSGNIPLLFGLALVGAEIGFFTDVLAQQYETGATSATDFFKNDYDVKRGAVNTTIGGVSGLAGGGLANAGLTVTRAAAGSVLIDSTLDEAGKTILTGEAPTAKGFATNAAINTAFLGSSQLGGIAVDAAKPYINKAKDYLPSFPSNGNTSTTINVENRSGPGSISQPHNPSVAMITTENGLVPLGRPNHTNPHIHDPSPAMPTGTGGTGSSYDSAQGQGLYVLYDDDGMVKYVGRGDAPARLVAHENSDDKGELVGDILWTNNLSKAQAKGLEQRLMDHFGGAQSQSTDTTLLNKIRSYSPENPNAQNYSDAATDELFEETLNRINQ